MSKDKNAEINEFYNKTQNLKSDFSKEMMNEEGDFYKD
jgi:hypothetical protein